MKEGGRLGHTCKVICNFLASVQPIEQSTRHLWGEVLHVTLPRLSQFLCLKNEEAGIKAWAAGDKASEGMCGVLVQFGFYHLEGYNNSCPPQSTTLYLYP